MRDGQRPHAVYRMFGSTGSLLYVGITLNVSARFSQHAEGKPWWNEVATITLAHYPDRTAATDAEVAAIRTEKPRYNVMHTVGSTAEQQGALARAEALAIERAELAGLERALIQEATDLGVRQADIARALDRSREHIRITLDPSKRRAAGHG